MMNMTALRHINPWVNAGKGNLSVDVTEVLEDLLETELVLLGQLGDDGLAAVAGVDAAHLQTFLDDLQPQNIAVGVGLGEERQVGPYKLFLSLHCFLQLASLGQLVNGAVFLGEQVAGAKEKLYDMLAAVMAKEVAIVTGQVLNADEMKALVDDLFRTSLPSRTPDGKSVLYIMSDNEIERMFVK